MGVLFSIVLSLLAIFLILLVLVQRGRGGGLAGALGGMGGSSAFGAKAGDVFTRITVVTAAIWISLSLIATFWANYRGDVLSAAGPAAPVDSPLDMVPKAPPAESGAAPATQPAAPADSAPATSSPPATDDTAPTTEK